MDLKAAEQSIIVRWILMILGGSVFQIVKLMSMEGIPWIQAWAMMFFISIIFGEVLILLARVLSLNDDLGSTLPLWRTYTINDALDRIAALNFIHSSRGTLPLWRNYKISHALDHIAIFPISLQFAFCFVVLVAFQTWFILWLGDFFEDSTLNQNVCVILVMLLWFAPVFRASSNFFHKTISSMVQIGRSSPPPRPIVLSRQRIYSWGCSALISFVLFPLYVRGRPPYGRRPMLWLNYHICFCLSWLLLEISNDLPSFSSESILSRVCRVDSFHGSQAVLLVFLTFIASILHYGVMFHPSGTVNPDWTGDFGR